jgi:hypothetical protein
MWSMSIKITLGQIDRANTSGTLSKVSDLIPPGAYKFRVAKLLDAVERELQASNKQRQALFKKYGKPGKDDKGKDNGTLTVVGIEPEALMAFNDALAALLVEETTIPYEPIIWGRLGPEAQEKLSVGDVRLLGPLLIEEDPNPAPAAAAPAPPALTSVPPAK